MERRKLNTEEADQRRAERKRLRSLIHDYCFNEQSGKGCANCPVNKAEACDHCHGSNEMPMKYLREAEKIILKEREAKQCSEQ
jgi:hypothetical protein